MRLTPLLLAALLLLVSHYVAYRIGRDRPDPGYDYQASVPRFRVRRATGDVEQLQRAENGWYWAPLGER